MSDAAPSRRWGAGLLQGRRLWAFGPGMVFALAAVGPQDLVSNAAAGSQYGYALLWVTALTVLARYVVLEASARYVVVTGETIMTGYARAGRWAPWMILGAIVLKRHISNLYQILLLGASADLLVPLPTRWSATIWSLTLCSVAFCAMFWGGYRLMERIGKPLILLLGGSLLAAAILSKPDLGELIHGMVVPSIPASQGGYSFALILMALVGAGSGSLSNLKYGAFVHEKGWRRLEHLRRQRMDLLLTAVGLFLMSVMIQVAAAGALGGSAAVIEDAEDLAPMFAAVLGESGRVVLGLGLWAAVFTTYLAANTGYSLLIADIYSNVLAKRPELDESASRRRRERAFRWALAWFCISPLYVLATDWKPVWIVLMASALMAALLPLVVCILLWLTSRKRLLGERVNGLASNLAMAAIVATVGYLTYLNMLDWL